MGSQNNDTKKSLESISNSVSGDGRKFVAELKQYLKSFQFFVDEKIDDIGEGGAAQVVSLKLTEEHTTDSNGMPQNNIVVEFDNTNVNEYLQAQIWMKSTDDYEQVGATGGVKYIIEGVTTGVTYTVKVVAVNKGGGTSNFSEAPTATITIQGSVLIPDAPTQFVLTWDEDGALWEWLHEDNGYVDFYELRLDANAGTYSDKLLDRTRNLKSRANPNVRSGTAYLFVRNIFGTYSLPAVHQFSKPVATKPKPPALEATLDGVVITLDALPSGYQGWKLKINNEEFVSYNRQFTYYQFSGTIEVEYCFFDYIGDGEWSDVVSMKIKTGIDVDELPVISYDAFDQTIKDAIDGANAQKDINKQLHDSINNLLDDLDKDAVNSPFTSIKQTADGITVLSAEITTVGERIETNASTIKQTADNVTIAVSKINQLEKDVSENTASISIADGKINSVVSGLNGSAGDSGYQALTGLASSIVQTNNSISSVITELNKDAEDCSYTAITQLQDGIDLCVKDEDLNGKEIISRINITPEVITIDGKYVHVTGDTVFDKNVIVGGYIASDTINTDHLKTNAVTTAKIATNAITADKINAGSITTEKLSNKSITAVKIADGTITATKIVDGAIGTTKIEGGAITTEKIQAGSIIGEHISAGAISADKLYAGNIDMTGALALVGGAVRLDENGLTCQMDDGYTVFDAQGITYFDKYGYSFGQIRKMCIGTAEHGSTIQFNGEWDKVPSVVCVPLELQVGLKEYSQSDVFMVCNATNVTKRGFEVQCYSKLGAGSISTSPVDVTLELTGSNGNTIVYSFGDLNKATPTEVKINISATTRSFGYGPYGKDDRGYAQWAYTCGVNLYNDGTLVSSMEELAIPAYPNGDTDGGVFQNDLLVQATIGAKLQYVGELKLEFTLKVLGNNYYGASSLPPSVPIFISTLGYTTEDEVVISTGTALFIATTNSSAGYIVNNGGATYGLRNQVRQG